MGVFGLKSVRGSVSQIHRNKSQFFNVVTFVRKLNFYALVCVCGGGNKFSRILFFWVEGQTKLQKLFRFKQQQFVVREFNTKLINAQRKVSRREKNCSAKRNDRKERDKGGKRDRKTKEKKLNAENVGRFFAKTKTIFPFERQQIQFFFLLRTLHTEVASKFKQGRLSASRPRCHAEVK